jgi:hypothetical protein
MPSRTESKVTRVAPGEEQDVIDFMQKLFWNLLSTQEIKTSDNYLQKKDDAIYQVHSTDHYIKMAFSRYLDTPHLDRIRSLEKEYFDLPEPVYPKLFPLGIWIWIVGGIVLSAVLLTTIGFMKGLLLGIGITGGIWYAYLVIKYFPNKERADRQAKDLAISREEVMERMKHLETLPHE